MVNLSVVIATYNEEKNIQRCLSSVKNLAREIILIDAKSNDKTVEIAKKLNCKIYNIDNDPLFHKNKQYGLEKASGIWILQLDADEEVTPALSEEIKKVILENSAYGYSIPRKNYFLGKFMKKGGLYPDSVIRLVKKSKAYFPCKSVHEQIKVEGEVKSLKNPLLHYPYPSIADYLVKANRYTSLTSDELYNRHVKVNTYNTFKYCIYVPFKTFLSIFIRHGGLFDGLEGFIWAFLSSTHYYFAYSKLINRNKTK